MSPREGVNGARAQELRGSRWRWLGPVVLLATLLFGAGVHEWHHVTDPGCGTSAESRAHGCWCTNLHASMQVADRVAAPLPVPILARFVVPRSATLVYGAQPIAPSPRAPPRS